MSYIFTVVDIEFKNNDSDEEEEVEDNDDTLPSLLPLVHDMPSAPEGGS